MEDAHPWHAAVLQVGTNMLDVYGARRLAGRLFETADAGRPVGVVDDFPTLRSIPAWNESPRCITPHQQAASIPR